MLDQQPANESSARTPSPSSADLGRVRAVIDALPEAVFVTESDGDLRLTNPAADRLFANRPIVDRSDLLARFEEIDAKPGRAGRIASLPDDAHGHLTVRPRDQPNRLFTLRTVDLDAARPGLQAVQTANPDQDESAAGRTVFVLRDVTESRDLRPVREAFLAVLSHELRTPITTIYAGSSVLARRPGLSPSATQTLAADISAEAARLYDLVEDLLVLARVERRVLDPLDEPVLIRRSVDSTIRMIAHRFGDVAIERTGDADVPPVHGDATYVDQACRNLIMASIRYAGSEPGRQLIVDVRVDPGTIEVSVRILDRGPNLADDELDHAFELPNGSAAGRLAGAGVGPFVARHLVEAMGGRVWTRNRPGGGLETGFALPIDERG
jgi:two-component system phosphate regulon sensor histidine kinase PhoR